MKKLGIDEFLLLAREFPVLDVRSPGEYGHAHIPGAWSLPLFTDEERKVVGTSYKQESREHAIKLGLDYFGVKMRKMVEDVEAMLKNHPSVIKGEQPTVLVHCWRGGMRSAGVAWLLDLYGFKVYTLVGGYKAYRSWAMKQFTINYPFKVLGGYTGSGKTPTLAVLKKNGEKTIDLEELAQHKGSAFGSFGRVQPSQEMFENLLAWELYNTNTALPAHTPIWIEDESQRIGLVNLPNSICASMKLATLYFVDIPFNARLAHITEEYGKLKKEELVNSIIRIQKRLGGQNTKLAINYLLEDNISECFAILLRYYDKHYEKSIQSRTELKLPIVKMVVEKVDPAVISQKLLE